VILAIYLKVVNGFYKTRRDFDAAYLVEADKMRPFVQSGVLSKINLIGDDHWEVEPSIRPDSFRLLRTTDFAMTA
jgi:hypothetical protein